MIPLPGFPMAMYMSDEEKRANDARVELAKTILVRQQIRENDDDDDDR